MRLSMQTRLPLCARVAVLGAVLAAFGGCQENTARRPVEIVTPAPVRGVIAQTSFENFQSDVWISIELLLSQRGVLDITVDWTFPDAWIYVYFGAKECQYKELAARTCPFILSSETKDPKPRVLVTDTLEPGKYYLVLYNVPRDPRTGTGSDATEAVSVQIGLTVTASGQRPSQVVRLARPRVVAPSRP